MMASLSPVLISSAHHSERRASSIRSLISCSAPFDLFCGPRVGDGGAAGGGAIVAMADCQRDVRKLVFLL